MENGDGTDRLFIYLFKKNLTAADVHCIDTKLRDKNMNEWTNERISEPTDRWITNEWANRWLDRSIITLYLLV